jgi:hypothetical protein
MIIFEDDAIQKHCRVLIVISLVKITSLKQLLAVAGHHVAVSKRTPSTNEQMILRTEVFARPPGNVGHAWCRVTQTQTPGQATSQSQVSL